MSTKGCLPLIDLATQQSPSTISRAQTALRQFGAFRLVAPNLTQHCLHSVFQDARGFFQLPTEVKEKTRGYSAFDSELVRGKTPFPKETVYFFKKGVENDHSPPLAFQCSVEALHDEWANLRSQLFSILSTILDSTEPLIGTPSLDSESLGVNFYDSDRLGDRVHFSPAHMDSGILTVLVRATDTEACDGLEIADLGTTEKLDSEGIGLDASFISVPAMPDEVIVLAGTRLQRLLGRSKVRACVHRVRSPTQTSNRRVANERLSLGIFCGPSIK